MPEGDTIHRTAVTLRRALEGSVVTGFRADAGGVLSDSLPGRRIAGISAHGKNLLIRFEGGPVLYTHMRMKGSWHIYRPGERWRKPFGSARVVLETKTFVAVCFNAPVVELMDGEAVARHPVLSRLGPDILGHDFNAERAGERLRAYGDLTIAEALLVQHAVAGIGNVYKSEALYLCGIDPRARVRGVSTERIERVLRTARELMLRNLRGFPRVTRNALDGGRYWVYRRGGRPCRRCGTRVRRGLWGATGRSTYWCPTCQGGPEAARS